MTEDTKETSINSFRDKLRAKLKLNKDVLRNVGWLFGDHLLTFAGGLLVSVWLARTLGPANYGIYTYAIALFAIASSFAHFGLQGVSIKELVETEHVEKSIGTIALLKAFGAILGVLGIHLYLGLTEVDGIKYWLSAIMSLAVLSVPFTTLDNYFDSVVESKYRIISRKTAFVARSLGIVAYIIIGGPLYVLITIAASEFLLASILVTYLYWRKGGRIDLGVDWGKVKELLSQSWPLIISSLGAILYLKMDQVMVVDMIGDKAGGYYGAAVRYTTIFYFLHTIVLTSFFPKLIEAKKNNESKYLLLTKQLSALLMYGSLSIVVFTYFFGGGVIYLLFGASYDPAIPIIQYHIFSLPIVFIGAILSKWLVIEKLTKLSVFRHGIGFVVNLVLNTLLIPIYGGVGAAIASVIALLFSSVVILLFTPRLRLLGWTILGSILYPLNLHRNE
jgi:PST family polysaccharide transporter